MHWFFDWNPRHAKRDCRLHPDFLRTDALTSLFTFFGLEDACLSQLHPSKKYWFFSSLVMSCRGCKRERDGSCGKWNISARRHSEHLSSCNPLHVGAILRDVHCGIELLDCGSIKILLEFREGHNCQKEESLLWVHLAFLHAPSSPTSHFQIPSWSRLNDMYQIEVAFRIWDQNRTAITFHDQTNGKMQWIKWISPLSFLSSTNSPREVWRRIISMLHTSWSLSWTNLSFLHLLDQEHPPYQPRKDKRKRASSMAQSVELPAKRRKRAWPLVLKFLLLLVIFHNPLLMI